MRVKAPHNNEENARCLLQPEVLESNLKSSPRLPSFTRAAVKPAPGDFDGLLYRLWRWHASYSFIVSEIGRPWFHIGHLICDWPASSATPMTVPNASGLRKMPGIILTPIFMGWRKTRCQALQQAKWAILAPNFTAATMTGTIDIHLIALPPDIDWHYYYGPSAWSRVYRRHYFGLINLRRYAHFMDTALMAKQLLAVWWRFDACSSGRR